MTPPSSMWRAPKLDTVLVLRGIVDFGGRSLTKEEAILLEEKVARPSPSRKGRKMLNFPLSRIKKILKFKSAGKFRYRKFFASRTGVLLLLYLTNHVTFFKHVF